ADPPRVPPRHQSRRHAQVPQGRHPGRVRGRRLHRRRDLHQHRQRPRDLVPPISSQGRGSTRGGLPHGRRVRGADDRLRPAGIRPGRARRRRAHRTARAVEALRPPAQGAGGRCCSGRGAVDGGPRGSRTGPRLPPPAGTQLRSRRRGPAAGGEAGRGRHQPQLQRDHDAGPEVVL
ncbi:MAG: hypothetical protein AVDCRST_MAG60-560, partial [uncultured Nocardioides sp.]